MNLCNARFEVNDPFQRGDKHMRSTFIAALVFVSLVLSSFSINSYGAPPTHISQSPNSKCLPEIVYTQEGVNFFRLHANFSYKTAKLEIKKYPIASWKTCVYSIGLYGYENLGGWIPMWSIDLGGNGMLFYDGFWHKQDTIFDISLDEVDLDPNNHGKTDRYNQLLVDYKAMTGSRTKTFIAVYYFRNAMAFSSDIILSFADDGNLDYTIANHAITIKGCFRTCEHPSSVTLRYDQEVHQFAIVNPTIEDEAFFNYIRRFDFPTAPYIP